jgi:hypothetical protein
MKYVIDISIPLPVLVPKNHGYLGITQASAIVLLKGEDGIHRIYYEGNKYGSENLESIDGRLQVAASRAVTKAPTVAFMAITDEILNEHFEEVGVYQYSTNTLLVDVSHARTWNQWLNPDESCVNTRVRTLKGNTLTKGNRHEISYPKFAG